MDNINVKSHHKYFLNWEFRPICYLNSAFSFLNVHVHIATIHLFSSGMTQG